MDVLIGLGSRIPRHSVSVNLHLRRGTVETDVYKALRDRINLFEAVVGRLQPILSRLPRVITETVLTGRQDREASRARAIEAVEDQAREMKEGGGFDLDEVVTEDIAMTARAESPVTLDNLDRVIGATDLMPPGTNVRAMGPREYALLAPGMDSEVRVTTEAAYYEEHAENVELWSPGNPLFNALELSDSSDEVTTGRTLKELLDSGELPIR